MIPFEAILTSLPFYMIPFEAVLTFEPFFMIPFEAVLAFEGIDGLCFLVAKYWI